MASVKASTAWRADFFLTVLDDNRFISRITPEGEITQLKWIDGSKPNVTLHGPKGMLLTKEHLIVADVHVPRTAQPMLLPLLKEDKLLAIDLPLR